MKYLRCVRFFHSLHASLLLAFVNDLYYNKISHIFIESFEYQCFWWFYRFKFNLKPFENASFEGNGQWHWIWPEKIKLKYAFLPRFFFVLWVAKSIRITMKLKQLKKKSAGTASLAAVVVVINNEKKKRKTEEQFKWM